jgi:hypothetical protein
VEDERSADELFASTGRDTRSLPVEDERSADELFASAGRDPRPPLADVVNTSSATLESETAEELFASTGRPDGRSR